MRRASRLGIILSLLAFVAAPAGVFARDYNVVELLALIDHQPELQKLQAQLASAQAVAERDQSAWSDPAIAYNLMDLGLSSGVGKTDNLSHRFTLSQSLPISGRLAKSGAIAAVEAVINQAMIDRARLELSRTLKTWLAEWTWQNELIGHQAKQIAWLEELAGLTKARYASGTVNQSTLFELEIDLVKARNQAGDLATANQDRLYRIRELVGLDEADFGLVAPKLSCDFGELVRSLRLADLGAAYRQTNPDRRQAALAIQAQMAKAELSSLAIIPDLALTAELTILPTNTATLSLGAMLSLPSLSLPSKIADRTAADRQTAAAQADLAALDNQVGRRIASLVNSLQVMAVQLERLTKNGLPSSQANIDHMLVEYQLQKADLAGVYGALTTHFELQSQYFELLGRLDAALFELEALCGLDWQLIAPLER